jgi:hypothetical protein
MARHTGEMQNRHGRGRVCLLLAGLVRWRSQFADTEIKESRQLCGGKHRPIRRATSKVAGVPASTVARLKRQHVNSPQTPLGRQILETSHRCLIACLTARPCLSLYIIRCPRGPHDFRPTTIPCMGV